MKTRAKLLGLVACGAIALTACGGDDSDSNSAESTTAATITKDEWITQATEICATGNKEIDAGAKEVFSKGQPSEEEFASFATDTLIPSVQSQIDQIRALGFPEGDEEQIGGALDDAQAALDDLSDDPASVAGDTPELNKAGKELSDYGATPCGN